MRQRKGNRQPRQGFTLIDMLVSTALIIFIMVILTQAFTTGMDTFRQLKTVGDMQEKLRAAASILRKDLAADHFEGKKRLSDLNFWLDGPPREGYFRIYQGAASVVEGLDGDGIPSNMAATHAISFTVKRRANQRDQFASVGIPANSPLFQAGVWNLPPDTRFQSTATFASQWYEVTYFLVSLGEQTPGGQARYALYRRQRLLVAQNDFINNQSPVQVTDATTLATALATYAEISCQKANPDPTIFPDQMYFNSPADVTIPQRRFGMDPVQNGGVLQGGSYQPISATLPAPLAGANPLYGSDLLITDVIGFDIQVLTPTSNDFVDLSSNLFTSTNPLFPGTPAVFDTWSRATFNASWGGYDYSGWSNAGQATSLPLSLVSPVRILAVQITIRVWDLKSQLARQITLVQDM
jgi:hypothetical protein